MNEGKRSPIEYRSATVAEVNYAQRIITVIAVPYGEPAIVQYRNEYVEETHERGAYANLKNVRPGQIKANRDHEISRTFGKVVTWDPDSTVGVVAEVRSSQTALGDESLALADDGVLGASVGFFIRNDPGVVGQRLERRPGSDMRRRLVLNAGVHHLALTPDPAFTGAQTLSVRDTDIVNAADLPPLPPTPWLDEWTAYLAARRDGLAS